jgi:hypothetical protein
MPRIRVAIRLKPEEPSNLLDSLVVRKKRQDAESLDTIELAVEGQRYEFSFDRIFQADATQENVFDECATILSNEVIEGYNGCIFAYGQTGAGKTYAMSGPTTNEYSQRGLVTRTISYLFDRSRQLAQFGDNISLRLSVLEIYNEVLIDLLRADNPTTIGSGVAYSSSMAPSKQPQQLRANSAHTSQLASQTQAQDNSAAGKLNVVDTPSGVMIPSLFVLPLANEEEANSLILEAYSNRVVAEHQLNKRSSRSHVLYTIYVTRTRLAPQTAQQQQSAQREIEPEVSQSKLHLVDLAGSERVIKTQSAGVVQREANYINKSLSFLEQVVLALTQSKRDHIPYRQSKLTFILKDSLGGNSNTYMIACIWPHSKHAWESLSTLRFGSRMSTIENTPIRNNLVDRSDGGVASQRLLGQIDSLKRELVMRDMVAGRDPWLPQLSNKQRELVFRQVADVVSAVPPAASAFRGSALLSSDNNALATAGGMDTCVQSLSHVRLLVDCMKLLVWEACGQDGQRVNDIIRAVIPQAETLVNINGTSRNYKSERSPAKRGIGSAAHVGGSELSIDVPGVMVRSMSDSPSRANIQLQSQSEQKPKQSTLMQQQQPFSANSKRSNKQNGSVYGQDVDADGAGDAWVNALTNSKALDTPKQPKLSPSDCSNNPTDGAADADFPEPPVLTFDEFRLGPQGLELHNAYEECKSTLKNNKVHQKEIIALINSIKARIDTTANQLQALKDKALEVNYRLQREMETMDNEREDDAEGTQSIDVVGGKELEGLQLQILELEAVEAESKKEYRAAHAELQASKQQAVEVQQLKQRAMAALVSAYDAATQLQAEQQRRINC